MSQKNAAAALVQAESSSLKDPGSSTARRSYEYISCHLHRLTHGKMSQQDAVEPPVQAQTSIEDSGSSNAPPRVTSPPITPRSRPQPRRRVAVYNLEENSAERARQEEQAREEEAQRQKEKEKVARIKSRAAALEEDCGSDDHLSVPEREARAAYVRVLYEHRQQGIEDNNLRKKREYEYSRAKMPQDLEIAKDI